MQILQSMTLTHLTADEYNQPAVKLLYETAYGIGLGIYDESTKTWANEASVESTVSSRRAITVSFTAVIPAEATDSSGTPLTEVAQTASASYSPATMVANIQTANTALVSSGAVSASAVASAIPTASDLTVSAPVQITASPTAAPTAGDSDTGVTLIIIITGVGAVTFCCCVAAVLVLAMSSKSTDKDSVDNVDAPGVLQGEEVVDKQIAMELVETKE